MGGLGPEGQEQPRERRQPGAVARAHDGQVLHAVQVPARLLRRSTRSRWSTSPSDADGTKVLYEADPDKTPAATATSTVVNLGTIAIGRPAERARPARTLRPVTDTPLEPCARRPRPRPHRGARRPARPARRLPAPVRGARSGSATRTRWATPTTRGSSRSASRRASTTGRPRPASRSRLVTHGAEESLILAEIRVTYRSPSYFGELLTVETRLGRLGRTSFTLEHRVTAVRVGARPRAARRDGRGRPGPVRLRDGAPARHPGRRASRAWRPTRAARSGAEARRAAGRLRLEAAEDRDRVLAAEAEAVDRHGVHLRPGARRAARSPGRTPGPACGGSRWAR